MIDDRHGRAIDAHRTPGVRRSPPVLPGWAVLEVRGRRDLALDEASLRLDATGVVLAAVLAGTWPDDTDVLNGIGRLHQQARAWIARARAAQARLAA